MNITDCPEDLDQLHERASRPHDGVVETLRKFPGNVAVLGAAGKMGYHLTRMVQRALEIGGSSHKVVAISRFSSDGSRDAFEAHGIDTTACDLSDSEQLADLPNYPNVFFLGGVKFGTSENPEVLHRFNVEMPGLVAARFKDSRIVALSTGCVYSYTQPESGGSQESDATNPVGAYAESCLGRELAFVNASESNGTKTCLIRLNYSVDLRYGVPVDIGQKGPKRGSRRCLHGVCQRDLAGRRMPAHHSSTGTCGFTCSCAERHRKTNSTSPRYRRASRRTTGKRSAHRWCGSIHCLAQQCAKVPSIVR